MTYDVIVHEKRLIFYINKEKGKKYKMSMAQ